ncbi:MAG: C40 family peptidase [Acidimicrobiales bacterium]
MRLKCAAVLAVASLAGATAVALPAGATPVVTTPAQGPSPSQVGSARAEAAALEARIVVDNQREQIAGERYDEAIVLLQRANALLARDRDVLARDARQLVGARQLVRSVAVADYVDGDSAAAQFGAVLSSSIVEASTVTAYAGVATTRLQSAVDALATAERRLRAGATAEAAATGRARAAVSSAAKARDVAAGAAEATAATLRRVRGRIAALIAQQEAAAAAAAHARAIAAAAAAAAARAHAEAQARAVALAAQREAEAQAAAAATVASAAAGSDPSSPAAQAAAASAVGSASAAGASGQPPIEPHGSSAAGLEAVRTAESYLGVPYVWGGASSAGLDCSGLTMLAWASSGVTLSHSAWYQYEESTHIPLSAIRPGDLLFYWFPSDGSDPVTHVAMYVGSGPYGTATIIQAPQPGQDVSYAPMYYYGLVGAARPGG